MEPVHDQRSWQNEAGADLKSHEGLGSRDRRGHRAKIFHHKGTEDTEEIFMSQHRSLKGASTIAAKRNVLKRFERVELLKKRGQFKDGSRVIGLPKTKPDV